MAPCQNYCRCTLQETCSAQWAQIAETIAIMFGGYTSDFTRLIDAISNSSDCENLDFYRNLVNYTTCDNTLDCIYREFY